MPVIVSTDSIRPAERQAFWTEAICRSFANVETRPLGPGLVSGHFEVTEIGNARVARFDTSPQSYSRNSRLVSTAGADDFMFDFQTLGRSWMIQGANEGAIRPGYGVLYDARRPFEDRLDGPGQRAEVLIVTVPAAPLLAELRGVERWCATPIPLAGALARSIKGFTRASLAQPACDRDEADIVACLAALLRGAAGAAHGLCRGNLFRLIDIHLQEDLAAIRSPVALAAQFGISERTFHRIFADRGTTFERHVLRRRVERFRELLSQPRLSALSIANLALECGFADAAHGSRVFKAAFDETPRDHRAGALLPSAGGRQQ